MLAAFHLNLTALSSIALLVGLFLVYNAVSVSVLARRQEIGTLRALGVSRTQVQALFLGEGALFGVLGVALGIPLARLLADATARPDIEHREHALRAGGRGRHPRWAGSTWCSPPVSGSRWR